MLCRLIKKIEVEIFVRSAKKLRVLEELEEMALQDPAAALRTETPKLSENLSRAITTTWNRDSRGKDGENVLQ